ncbi:hypothetical protein HSBAA_37960 [Vreelandella sulfidaeris]|uniref:Uncharacterized protein n=1 Tax=Vreelandella sulfidaeris TaxID=115553 RepID=A0A455U8I3_9GAMM|nr:hypothetical protein HSBAA_37960 [Halomonas sulfidaeris]
MLLSGRPNHHTNRLETSFSAIYHLHCRGVKVRRVADNHLTHTGRKVLGGITDDF